MNRTIFSQAVSPLLQSTLIKLLTPAVVIALLIGIAALPAPGQDPPTVNFLSGELYSGVGFGDRIPGAANVYTFAVADFDGDEKLDFIATNDSNVWGIGLVLGNGDGSFQTPVKIVGNDSYGAYGGIVAGNFNGDVRPDFAVLSLVGYGPIQLSVYLNDGTGHFVLASTYPVGSTAGHISRELAAADVNGDGKLDLIVPDLYSLKITVFYGNADGTFPTSAEFSASVLNQTSPTGVAVGDFNKDGKPDIVAASATGCCPLRGGITVLLNQSNGAFAAPVQYDNPNGVDNGLVAVADMNGDGNLDVVESSEGGSNIAVFLGKGDGTFQTGKNFSVPWASGLAVGDVNGDQKPDIVSTAYPDGSVWVLLNKGGGNFQGSSVYTADSSSAAMVNGMWVALADLDGDHKLDFITGNPAGQFVTVGRGNGDGTFHDSPSYNESPGIWGNHFAVADFNRDGNLDIVEAGGGTGVGLSVLLGDSHGVFRAPTFINLHPGSNGQVSFVRTADVNNDGKVDIICVNYKGAVVLTGLGTGEFNPPVTYPVTEHLYPVVVWLDDLNRDGALDIVTSNQDGTMSTLLNKGNGVFDTATVFPSGTGGYASQFVLGDFNSDGKHDIVVADHPAAKLYSLTGNGNGTFQSPVLLSSPIRPRAIVTQDFNKDGKLDLAIAGSDYSGSFVLLLGNGDGTFNPGTTYEWFDDSGCNPLSCGHYPWSMIAVDLNGDDNLDVAIAPGNPWYLTCGGYRCAEQYLGAVVFLGKGNGTFVEQFGWLAGIAPTAVETGDFNRDGMPDLAFLSTNTNYGATSITVLQNATAPLSFSPRSVTFSIGLHATSVILTNDQTTKLNIQSITLGGKNPNHFVLQHNCGNSLAAGLRCTINLGIRHPLGRFPWSALLVIKDDLGTQTVPLIWKYVGDAKPAAAIEPLQRALVLP